MTVKVFVIISTIVTMMQAANAQQINEKELKVNTHAIVQPLKILKTLEPITFNFNTDKYKSLDLPKVKQFGFVTENADPDVLLIQSKIHTTGKNTTKTSKYESVNNEALIPVLVAAIREQQEQIEILQKEIADLKK